MSDGPDKRSLGGWNLDSGRDSGVLCDLGVEGKSGGNRWSGGSQSLFIRLRSHQRDKCV